jgi:hypothetical protein
VVGAKAQRSTMHMFARLFTSTANNSRNPRLPLILD